MRQQNSRRPARSAGRSNRQQAIPEGNNPRARWPARLLAEDVAPGANAETQGRRQALIVCGLLLLALALVYGQTIRHEFVNFDDDVYVYENPHVAHGLTVSRIAWAFAGPHRSVWVPLTWISLMLDSQLYDLSAGGFHLTNALLHAAAVVILFLVLWRMTGGVWSSGLVAAVFALHPLRVESVAWITERKDVLSGLFFMSTLAAYLGYVRYPSRLRYLAIMVLLTLGLMAKGMLVTLPVVLLLLDYWPLGRMDHAASDPARYRARGWLRRLSLLALAVVFTRGEAPNASHPLKQP